MSKTTEKTDFSTPPASASPSAAAASDGGATKQALTMRDFARRVGVSKTTVSKAFTGNGRIAPATRDTILRAAREHGFDLNPHAQRLSVGRSDNLISLYCPGGSTGVATRKIWRIQELLAEQGFDAPVYSTGPLDSRGDTRQTKSLERLCRLRPSAIVCSTLVLPDRALAVLRAYQTEHGGAVVLFDAPVAMDAADSVVFDRVHNTYQGVRHLLENGHRKIGLSVTGTLSGGARFLLPRMEGFCRAMSEFGLPAAPPPPEWFFEGGDSEEDGAKLAAAFLALSPTRRPTALYISGEDVASSFVNQLLRAGLQVPRDVSVVTHDDLPAGRFAVVRLTTVSTPVEEIAQGVARLVQQRLRFPSRPFEQIMVRGELLVRESTGVCSSP